MKRSMLLITGLLLMGGGLSAQRITVQDIKEITRPAEGKYYYPKMSPDGTKIIFTSVNYKGLWTYEMQNGQISQLTDKAGAGYEFEISPDGKEVLYRANVYDGRGIRTSQELYRQSLTGVQAELVQKSAELSSGKYVEMGKVAYTEGGQLKVNNIDSETERNVKPVYRAVVYVEDQQLAIYQNGQRKELAPMGQGNYIWPSVSPDGEKLVFTLAGKGTYVSDLNGRVLYSLGYANAPRWSNDGQWIVYMVDRDNGVYYTESDIYVSSVDGSQKYQLTQTEDKIEMYPEWSSDASKIVMNTEDGRIFMITIKIDQVEK